MPTTVPPRVTFQGLLPSPSLEALIKGEIDELERSFDRIVSCRVAVELPHRHQRRGRLYRVVVEVSVPGAHVVVGSSPDQRAMHANARIAVRDAFGTVRRQLEERGRRRHERNRAAAADAP
ncbi:MAG TPA: HPF/RaiA family ribosome-associated protein [Polyangia bacterium]|nr:HPF/RaiA family ribosome-associated protein [Polyangia bacterium]